MSLADPREHYCLCGKWAPFGFRADTRHPTTWRCGLVGGTPTCLEAPPPATAATPDAAVAPALESDLFNGA